MNRLLRICTLIFLGVLLLFGQKAFATPILEKVTAEVESSFVQPRLVNERMEKTVAIIAEQLMAGKTLAEIEKNKSGYEQIVKEVFDKVLVGYSVKKVSVYPMVPITKVVVELIPWAQVIEKINLEIIVEGMQPEIEALVRKDLGKVEDVFLSGLNGLPVAAADWTNGVLKGSLNEYMENYLPEFRADFEMLPNKETSIKVVVYPRLPVVRSIDLNMRSDTLPNVVLLGRRYLLQEAVDKFIGVPVNFIKRHRADFEAYLGNIMDSIPNYKRLGIKTKVSLTGEEKLTVMSRSDTDKFTFRVEGWIDILRRNCDDNRKMMVRAYAGKHFSKEDEIFVRLDFYPQEVDAEWAVGYSRMLTKTTEATVRYDMNYNRFALGVMQRVAPKWYLRYEYRWADQKSEAALRYRMHDFIALEYIHDKVDNWMRVIGYF